MDSQTPKKGLGSWSALKEYLLWLCSLSCYALGQFKTHLIALMMKFEQRITQSCNGLLGQSNDNTLTISQPYQSAPPTPTHPIYTTYTFRTQCNGANNVCSRAAPLIPPSRHSEADRAASVETKVRAVPSTARQTHISQEQAAASGATGCGRRAGKWGRCKCCVGLRGGGGR